MSPQALEEDSLILFPLGFLASFFFFYFVSIGKSGLVELPCFAHNSLPSETMGASVSSPVFADNGEFFMDTGNIVGVSYQNASKAFSTPVAANSVLFPGFDWTQPFPGASKDGHAVYLTIAHDMPMNETVVQNSSTVLSSLTFGIPNGMMSGGQPLPMNPSWYLCRHIFISTKPEVKTAVDGGKGCSFLSQDCLADLKLGLTKNWGTADDMAMCSQLIHDPIPPSCVGSFGYSRQDVLGMYSATAKNKRRK